MTINRKERLWRRLDGEGTYASFTLHDTVDISNAAYDSDQTFIKLDPSKDLVAQVVALGIKMDGEGGGMHGESAASYARIFTISTGGKRVPKEDDINIQFEKGTIQFGHVVPREGAFIEDARSPKAGAPLDEQWVCATRCGIKQHVMETDVVVATPLHGGESFTGKTIYDKGVVSKEWLAIVPRLHPSRTENIFSNNGPLKAASLVKG